ncbi:SH3 domain-containing protein 21 isoform X2 [Amia ocellicauda]|uniref:SH3 domain-containing protein 21 isoform X2 n=1 Tax=Amia ocellicauda TaxID=2972642 RepID=UPI0034643DA3
MEVLVLIDFTGNGKDELCIQAGDIIKNTRKSSEDGWLEGELSGKTGLFPISFVKEIPVCLTGDNQRVPRSIRTSKSCKKATRKCEVTYAYAPVNVDELELSVGEVIDVVKEIEDGWWLGCKNGKMGVFPSNFVKEITSTSKDAKSNDGKTRPKLSDAAFNKEPKQQQRTSIKSKTNNVKECCQVLFDFQSSAADELDLKKGDIVTVISKETEDEGWWEGELKGKCGFFPDNFVMVIPSQPLGPGSSNCPPVRKASEKGAVSTSLMEKIFEQNKPDPSLKAGAKDEKNDTKDLRSDPPSKVQLPGIRKVPPPVKNKPNKITPGRSNGELPPLSPKPGEDKTKEKDGEEFDGIDVSIDKLTHPTANRAKPPARRPPSNLNAGHSEHKQKNEVDEMHAPKLPPLQKAVENQSSVPSAAKNELHSQLPKVSPLKPIPLTGMHESKPKAEAGKEQKSSVDELRAEIREFSMALELLKLQHVKDVEELKQELSEERSKRTALQEEVQLLKKSSHHQ